MSMGCAREPCPPHAGDLHDSARRREGRVHCAKEEAFGLKRGFAARALAMDLDHCKPLSPALPLPRDETSPMTEPMRFYSTNRNVPDVGLREALLQGQAKDRGLFMPRTFPVLTRDNLDAMRSMDYPGVACAVLRLFTSGVIDDDKLAALCEDAYNFDVPLDPVEGRRFVLRLDRGPTASFKDFAARMMARWMSLLMPDDGVDLVILTATSGDTGSAVAHAYHGVPRVSVVVLFPVSEVSDRQRRQMTTLGGNVTTVAVDGKFDDCQALVKRAFSDPEIGHIRLSSANSINIGRLLPQAVYYFYAWSRVAAPRSEAPVVFSIPSGNFGDMMGAVIAKRMGLPIERLVIATNANDEVPRYLATGTYEKIVPSRECISNAMNVGHPSNLARLVDLYGGWLDETGAERQRPDLDRMRRDLFAVSISDDETRATIRNAWNKHGLLLEPHGAVAWAGLLEYLAQTGSASGRSTERHGEGDPLYVSVATAHPAKFPDDVRLLTGVEPEVPPSLQGLEERTEHFESMAAHYDNLRDLLDEHFRRQREGSL